MSFGKYKFVLSKVGVLYIGSAGDFHQEIAGIQHHQVRAAGYLAWGRENKKWVPNGKSIGHRVDVNGCEEEVIALLPITEGALIGQMSAQTEFRAKFGD